VQKGKCVFCSHESKFMLRMTRRFHKKFTRELSTNLSVYKGYKFFSEVGCICKWKNLSKWPFIDFRE